MPASGTTARIASLHLPVFHSNRRALHKKTRTYRPANGSLKNEEVGSRKPIKERSLYALPRWANVLLLCRQITHEVQPLFYGSNFFQIQVSSSCGKDFEDMFPPPIRD